MYQMGIQEAAREIRYAWFSRLLDESKEKNHQQPYLVTAHHADDQVETVLMQLARGTGLHGLTGIPSKRTDSVHVVRPLLIFSKDQIIQYANENDLYYVEDSSNLKADYTRNLIRLEMIPKLQNVFPQVSQNMVQTIERLKESEQIVDATIASFWKLGRKKYKGIDCIKIAHWLKVSHLESYTWGIIKPLGFRPQQISEVHKLLHASTGAYIISDSHKLVKYKDLIQIVPLVTNVEHQLIYGEGALQTNNGTLQIQIMSREELGEIPNDKKVACLNADHLDWPLLLRSWQPTDYFYPFGTNKKKKLNQFLAAAQLSPVEKEKTIVIASGDCIVWVVGQRMDHRFRITETTKHVLKLMIQ
jgi:tRNA(Ile)-lysidine synthase